MNQTKGILQNAIMELRNNKEAVFILDENLYSINKVDGGDFDINVWNIDQLNSNPEDGGVCYGNAQDAVLFMLPEQDVAEFKKETLQIDIKELYELIMAHDCFTIDDGAMLYNINQGSTDEEDDQDARYLIEAFWEEEGEEKDLHVVWSDITKIEFNCKWEVFHIFRKNEEHTIELKILETISVIPKGVEDAK
jgi:hypothetical protein